MQKLRTLLGFGALAGIVVALNLLTWYRSLSAGPVVVPLTIGVACGAVWLLLAFVQRSGTREGQVSFNQLNAIFASLVFLAICIVLFAFAKRWDQTWDLTYEGQQELAPQTVQVLEGLTSDVEVIGLFADYGEQDQEITRQRSTRFLERCAKLTTHLKLSYIDPVENVAKLQAMGLTFWDPRGSIVMRSGNRQRTIALSGAIPRLEERDFTNALINVVQATQPKIGFLSGHGERDINGSDLALLKSALQSEGYAIEPVSLRAMDNVALEDYQLLALVGLAEQGGDLNVHELALLDTYIDAGGRLLVMLDPQFAEDPTGTRKQIFSWLFERFGIRVGEDLVISRTEREIGNVLIASDVTANAIFAQVNAPNVEFEGCFDSTHPITQAFDKDMSLLVARSISLADKLPPSVVGSILLRTLPYAWAETDLRSIKVERKQPEPDPNEISGSIPVAVASTFKTTAESDEPGVTREARIVVVGDSDFINSEPLRMGGNLNFVMNAMAWLTAREELIAIRPRGRENEPIQLSQADETVIAWISSLGVLQVVLAIAFAGYLMLRKYR